MSAVSIVDLPRKEDVLEWLVSFYETNKQKIGIRLDDKDKQTSLWFLELKLGDWRKSGRALTTNSELVFGTNQPSIFKARELVRGLKWYADTIDTKDGQYPDRQFSPWNTHSQPAAVSQSLLESIQRMFVGIPEHFVRVSYAHLTTSPHPYGYKCVPLSKMAIIAFQSCCERQNIPVEIIRMILLYLGIDIFKDNDKIWHLGSAEDFEDALFGSSPGMCLPDTTYISNVVMAFREPKRYR